MNKMAREDYSAEFHEGSGVPEAVLDLAGKILRPTRSTQQLRADERVRGPQLQDNQVKYTPRGK